MGTQHNDTIGYRMNIVLTIGIHHASYGDSAQYRGNVQGSIALYLDADVPMRKDLRELWSTDFKGRALATVPDIGRDPWDGHSNSRVLVLPGPTPCSQNRNTLATSSRVLDFMVKIYSTFNLKLIGYR